MEHVVELLDLDVEIANRAQCLADPDQLLARFQCDLGQHVGEERHGCPKSAVRDAHVVQRLDVVPESRARLLREQGREMPAQDGQGDRSDRHLRVDLAHAESRGGRRTEIMGQKPDLELAETRRLQRACVTQLENECLEGLRRGRRHLDLDPLQPHRGSSAMRADRGLVERDHPRWRARGREGEGAAAGAHLEQREKSLCPSQGTHPAANGAVGALECLHVRAFQALAHLESAARSRSTDGSRVESLQRRLGPAPATETANPKRIARFLEAPVVGLDVDIDLGHAVSVCDDLRSRRVAPPLRLIQPALYRTKVDRVELPFDLAYSLSHPMRNRAEIVASCSSLL